MKIRNGFISNSSSASFIIKWKPKDFELLDDAKHYIDCLLNNGAILDDILSHTYKTNNSFFVTIFDTDCFNDITSFDINASIFLSALVTDFAQLCKYSVDIIDKEIDENIMDNDDFKEFVKENF